MTAINETYTAKGYTPAAQVPAAFGVPRTLDGIVIHHWGDRGQTHQGVVNFFCSTGPGSTSAHFVVSAGRIDCIVSPLDAAWHCPGKNPSTIGIECRPEATDADYATVAELVAWLRATYNKPLPLSRHRDWYATACPGVWDLERINRLASGAGGTIETQSVTPKEDTLSAKEVQEIKNHINAVLLGGYSWAGKKHPGIGKVVEENQRRVTALRAVVEQLAAKQGVDIDYAKIEAIVDKSIADADLLTTGDVVSVDVNVTGK